jgi:hypothetical protein
MCAVREVTMKLQLTLWFCNPSLPGVLFLHLSTAQKQRVEAACAQALHVEPPRE